MKRSSSEGGGPAKKRKCGYCNEEGLFCMIHKNI